MADVQFPDFWGDRYKNALIRESSDRRDARRRIGPDLMPALGGDQEALGRVAQADPDVALRVATIIHGMDAKRSAAARGSLEMGGRLAAGVLLAPPDQQPALYAAALEQARGLGLDTSKYPTEWGPAAKAWLQHNATMMGSVTSILKRIGGGGAPAGGGGAPAGGGWGGPPAARTSDATPPGAPATAVAGMPQSAPMPQIASAVPPPGRPKPPAPSGPMSDDLTDFEWGGAIAGAPQAPVTLAGAGSLPMAVPPAAPQIAPPAAPASRPNGPSGPQLAAAPPAGGVPADDSGSEGDFVGGADAERAFKLQPGEQIKLEPKTGKPIVDVGGVWVQAKDGSVEWRLLDPQGRPIRVQQVDLGDRVQIMGSGGEVLREIKKAPPPKPVERVEPLGAPASAAPDPKAAVRGLNLPPGYRVGGSNGVPIVKDGTVLVVTPDGSYDFVPLPTRVDPATKPGRPLPQSSIDKLTAAGTSAQEFAGLLGTFDDSFGGYKSDFVGGLDNFRKRNLPDSLGGEDPKGQVDWWARYQEQKNIIRHALFGSALTATEKAEFDKAMIDTGMKPDKIRINLARQADAAMRAAAKIAGALEASGYGRDSIERALGLPLDSLPSPTAKPAADAPRAAGAGPAAPAAKPPEIPQGRADDLRRRYNLD